MNKTLIALFCSVFLFTNLLFVKAGQKTIVATHQVNGLSISIDSRQELISIVQYLGDYFRLNKFNLEYKKSIDQYFEKYKDHEAVLFVKELSQKGFTYDAPPATMLYLSDELNVDKEIPEYLLRRIGGEEQLKKFVSLLAQFVEDTHFNEFIESHQSFYKGLVDNMATQLIDFNEIENIEKFYGKKQNTYNIILSCLNSGNYGPGVSVKGKLDIYNIMSPRKEENGQPVFGQINDIEYLVWHEFGHSYVNYLTEENNDLVEGYKQLLNPIKDQMKKQAYGSWTTVVNEQVIRAVTTFLAKQKYGNEIAEKVMYKEVGRGFIYTEPMMKALEIYSNNRSKYSTFADYYPTLIKTAFDDAKTNDYTVQFMISINQTFANVDYIVVSEKEDGNEGEILNYVIMVRDKFMKDKQIITDKEALDMDISQYSFMIYGTEKNNLLLKKFKTTLPIITSESSIKADKEYELSDGKAIFNMQNPANPEKYLLIYTAQKSDGIVNINNVFHGPTNYVVFRDRNNVLKSGTLVKVKEGWKCL
nr:DUF4932 domain-containing protein [uncultured Carboxylicivirga sp.]